MLRVRLRVLLLLAAHMLLLCAEKSHTEESPSIGDRDKAKPATCGKDCEDRTRKRRTPGANCELYYYVPTAKQGETFSSWNNTKAEQLNAYGKIALFLQKNPHERDPIFFPAHLPLAEKRNGSEVLVLTDVYVRAKGTCGQLRAGDDTSPDWLKDRDQRLQKELEMLENYVQRIPRSHFGYRVPQADEDVCLDETGLVVKDFPGIRTCFSMWIFDDRDSKPKHFAGRQNYNRINQRLHVNVTDIGFDPLGGGTIVGPIETESLSLPALFLNETCRATNESLENNCAYWTTTRFYASLCCCYTNRTECAYRKYVFPAEKKVNDPVVRACATGRYSVMKHFGGTRKPTNAGSSVKEFVQERTSSEVCKWTYTWDPSNETTPDNVLRVELDAENPAALSPLMQNCVSDPDEACCQRTTTLCPLAANSTNNNSIVVECFCSDGDLCNKRRSYLNEDLVRKFKEARPCEAYTVQEHLLWHTDTYKKPNTSLTKGYMCPIFYNFAQPARQNAFLQLLDGNNWSSFDETGDKLFHEDDCHLVEAYITEAVNCSEKLFGEHDETVSELLLILMCTVEGNPLGENRTSYPDATLKKTIEANLTDAKAEFPTCKNGSWSMDFESVSELVVDGRKLERMYNTTPNGTNDNITTVYCFSEVSFVYQQQYNFTFGAVSIDDKSLRDSCVDSEEDGKCVQLNSAADDEHQHFACCCRRHWSKPQDMCRDVLLGQLKTLLGESVIAKKPEQIMSELTKDPLKKCDEPDETHKGTELTRPCERNEGCYTSVHARDVPTSTHHKHYGGCVSEDAPDARKRDDVITDEVVVRFYRICRLPRHDGQCFAVLGTEDTKLPDDIKGPQMVCCCKGKVESAKKCGSTHKYGERIRDLV